MSFISHVPLRIFSFTRESYRYARYGVVSILHSGLGCGIGQLFGQFYADGQNSGGPQGGTNAPCSGLVEEHVIFGCEDKLRRLINRASS